MSDSDAPTSLVVAAPTVQAALSQVPDDTTEEVVSIRIPGPWIGIRLSDENEGIIVTEVYDGSPGATAGIAVGDRIVSVSGEPVHSANRFVARVRRLQIGDTLTLHCAHSDGTDTDLHIELAERPLPESQRPSGTTNTEPEGSSFCPAYPWPDTGDANAALLLYERAMANGFHDPAAATNPALQSTAREAWMDAILEFHLLENGVTVVPPQKADSERLNKLAAQLDELAESLKAVSEEVKALRDAK